MAPRLHSSDAMTTRGLFVLGAVAGLAGCGAGGPGPSSGDYAACEARYELIDRNCADGGCAPSSLGRATYDHFIEFGVAQTGLSRDALLDRVEVLDIRESDGIIWLDHYVRFGEYRMYRTLSILEDEAAEAFWGNLDFSPVPEIWAIVGRQDPVVDPAVVEAAMASCDARVDPTWCYVGLGPDPDTIYTETVFEQGEPYACIRASVNLFTGELVGCDPNACEDGE
jgi:hypothetical protein